MRFNPVIIGLVACVLLAFSCSRIIPLTEHTSERIDVAERIYTRPDPAFQESGPVAVVAALDTVPVKRNIKISAGPAEVNLDVTLTHEESKSQVAIDKAVITTRDTTRTVTKTEKVVFEVTIYRTLCKFIVPLLIAAVIVIVVLVITLKRMRR